jgi:hypothetical protein
VVVVVVDKDPAAVGVDKGIDREPWALPDRQHTLKNCSKNFIPPVHTISIVSTVDLCIPPTTHMSTMVHGDIQTSTVFDKLDCICPA